MLGFLKSLKKGKLKPSGCCGAKAEEVMSDKVGDKCCSGEDKSDNKSGGCGCGCG